MFSEQDINRYNYRLRFQEMENKIKKCEIERNQLEQKFSQLMRERQECEKAAERSLKQKYKRMMELERMRAERNETLLRMLYKIDQQAASLAAKSDRLKMLKEQYESYLIRSWSTQHTISSDLHQAECSSSRQSTAAITNANLYSFPSRAISSPKSEFVRYLTEATYVPTTDPRTIPPPMALSNYISHQQYQIQSKSADRQLSTVPAESESYSFPTEYHHLPQYNQSLQTKPAVSPKTKLSNEEFIRYVDNEILKESLAQLPISTITPNIVVDPPSQASTPQYPTAYLEDLKNDNDDSQVSVYYNNSSPALEEIVDATAQFDINCESDRQIIEEVAVFPADNSVVSENCSAVHQQVPLDASKSEEEQETAPTKKYPLHVPEPTPTHSLQGVVEQTLLGMISEVEENFVAKPVPDNIIPTDSGENTVEEPVLQTGEESQLEPSQDYSKDGNYQLQYMVEENTNNQPYNMYLEGASAEYADQESANHAYEYEQVEDRDKLGQQDPNVPELASSNNSKHWSTAFQAIKSRGYTASTVMPETIEEVTNNGELQSPETDNFAEKRITPPDSKRSTPLGRNVSSVSLEPVPEFEQAGAGNEQQVESCDPAQYDYEQYQQQYAQNSDETAYQYEQETLDPQFSQSIDEQINQDPSQMYFCQQNEEGNRAVDPSQYQQATEYPGPTQYVFEQDYYAGQQSESEQQQFDQNPQAYYDPNNQDVLQQYYSGEEQVQYQQQEAYDQSQLQQEVYDQSQLQLEASESAIEYSKQEEPDSLQQEAESVSKTDEPINSEALTNGNNEGLTGASDEVQKNQLPPATHAEEKLDTTLSSVNDDSDFDFSTQ